MVGAAAERSKSRSTCGERTYHARVQEGVAKRQFPLKGSGLHKPKPHVCEILKGFTPSTTLAWYDVGP